MLLTAKSEYLKQKLKRVLYDLCAKLFQGHDKIF